MERNAEPAVIGAVVSALVIGQVISGRHVTFLHFALYESKGDRTSDAQVSLRVETAHEAAVAAGAEVLHEPPNEPWGRTARYRDYDGNMVELTQPR